MIKRTTLNLTLILVCWSISSYGGEEFAVPEGNAEHVASPVSPVAAPTDSSKIPKIRLRIDYSASQSVRGVDKTACGQMFQKGKATGRKVYLSGVMAGIGDNPIYQESIPADGLHCFSLINVGSNDFAWGLGAHRAPQCACGQIIKTKI